MATRRVAHGSVVMSRREQWVQFCKSIGGEQAVVTRLAEVIHDQRSGLDGEPVCGECLNRARLFFDAAAEADWWPLGYGIFKLLSNLMDCTEDERRYAPADDEEHTTLAPPATAVTDSPQGQT